MSFFHLAEAPTGRDTKDHRFLQFKESVHQRDQAARQRLAALSRPSGNEISPMSVTRLGQLDLLQVQISIRLPMQTKTLASVLPAWQDNLFLSEPPNPSGCCRRK